MTEEGQRRNLQAGEARLLPYFVNALQRLGLSAVTVDPAVQERVASMASLIHESMSTESRVYHALEHVFELLHLLGDDDPVVVLAVLFHDVVYVNVDGGLSSRQASILQGISPCDDNDEPNGYRIDDDFGGNDEQLKLVALLFDYTPGRTLRPTSGVNEFLSAVVAVRELGSLSLPLPVLAQIATCIEATFPFRARKSVPVTPMERLYEKLGVANEECQLNMTDDDRVHAVKRALTVINEADLSSFGDPNVAAFLSKTWDLLPETNPSLRHPQTFTVAEYAFAVKKMIGLFDFLTPTIIFQEFRGCPTPDRLSALRTNAKHNIDCARLYLRAMLLGLSVLSALLELSGGGDAPMHRILGDEPQSSDGLANCLPAREYIPPMEDPSNDGSNGTTGCERQVLELLSEGRSCDSAFDVRQAPVAAHLYAHLGSDGLQKVCDELVLYPMNESTAWALLRRLRPGTVSGLASTLSAALPCRAAALSNIVELLR